MSTVRIEQLLESSAQVLRDCSLENGAIVAANSDHPDYPHNAENYRFSWMRDSAHQIIAAHELDMPEAADIRARYLGWLTNVTDIAKDGIFVKRYATNGAPDQRYGREYQPDQAGSMLCALYKTQTCPDRRADMMMRRLANGLVRQWEKTHSEDGHPMNGHFRSSIQDLWENRITDPVRGDNFTHSLAAATLGLHYAAEAWRSRTLETDIWQKASADMRAILEANRPEPYYLRKIYPVPTEDTDNTLDASLTLEFSDIPLHGTAAAKRKATILEIGKQLCRLPDGIKRYVGDTYDGIVRPDGREATAGRWPLLTFSYAQALLKIGEPAKALEIYNATVEYLDELYKAGALPNNLIPEQVFPDNRQSQAVLPLAWSHAMFVTATKALHAV